MKTSIAKLVAQAIGKLPELADLPQVSAIDATVERTRDARHGDFTCNIAMRLAKSVGKNPRNLAEEIIGKIPDNQLLDKVAIAGPGFINFSLSDSAFHEQLVAILDAGVEYGRQPQRERPRVLLEFVSANPTGPLHVGHGRHAAYGATVGNLLEAAGYPVEREYYVNDAGRQMDILGLSVWLRMLESRGLAVPLPEAGYKGAYVADIAEAIDAAEMPPISAEELTAELPADAPEGDKEAFISAFIERARQLLGEQAFLSIRRQAFESILEDIKDDLGGFGVYFDCWFSEQSLTDDGLIDDALKVLEDRGMLYKKGGATWFRATDFGDEKDRVVVRDNGKKTYFASDIAYHYGKRVRDFDLLLDVLGQDHHGYIARVQAGLQAMGYAGDSLEVKLMQFVALYRAGEKQQMSTRSGEFITLRQLREEVGNDAARFFYVMRSNDQHLDFDLDLAKSHSHDNPVYYIQYAHARICSVFRQLDDKNWAWDRNRGEDSLDKLTEQHEKALMTSLSRYPEIIELSAANRAPQHLVHYLRDLANELHSYYNAHIFLVEDTELRDARLLLIGATRTVIANGLAVLGVSAPESM